MIQVSTFNRLAAWFGLVVMTYVLTLQVDAQTQDPLQQENPIAYARATSMKTAGSARVPSLIAVRFHHDSCPYCKKLQGEYAKVSRASRDDAILWITLDLSNEWTQKQSASLLATMGMEGLWTGNLASIGTVMFVDGTTKRPVRLYRHGFGESLASTLKKAISGRSGK